MQGFDFCAAASQRAVCPYGLLHWIRQRRSLAVVALRASVGQIGSLKSGRRRLSAAAAAGAGPAIEHARGASRGPGPRPALARAGGGPPHSCLEARTRVTHANSECTNLVFNASDLLFRPFFWSAASNSFLSLHRPAPLPPHTIVSPSHIRVPASAPCILPALSCRLADLRHAGLPQYLCRPTRAKRRLKVLWSLQRSRVRLRRRGDFQVADRELRRQPAVLAAVRADADVLLLEWRLVRRARRGKAIITVIMR